MNKLLRRIFQSISIIIFMEIISGLYSTADKETQREIKFFWTSETRLIREFFVFSRDYLLNTWKLIIEKDILEMHKERKLWKRGFVRFSLVIKLIIVRTFKSSRALFKAFLYPVKIIGSLVFSIIKTTFIFVEQIYSNICLKLTSIVTAFLWIVSYLWTKIQSLLYFLLYLFEDLILNVEFKTFNLQSSA